MNKVTIAAALAALVLSGCRRENPNAIRISGNIELTEVGIGFKVAGRLIERKVDEGDRVEQGQLIGRLDREQVLKQRERDHAAVLSAESQLVQLRTGIAWQKDTLEHDIAQRQADLAQVEAKLRELEAGSRPQEIREARAGVEAAQAEYDRARKDWDRAQELIKNDDISKSQFDQFRSRNESAEAALRQARERSALVVEGPRKEDIDAARAQVERARAAVGLAEANRLELQRRQEEVAARQAEIERSRAQLGITNTQIDDTLAYSPISGVVLTKAAEAGEVLAPGTPVVTVGDLKHPWVRGYIGEQDLGRVKIGSRAKVTTDSFPGKVYDGQVSFIASQAEFTPKQIQTEQERVKLVYRIKIEVQNPNGELKANMPVEAEISF